MGTGVSILNYLGREFVGGRNEIRGVVGLPAEPDRNGQFGRRTAGTTSLGFVFIRLSQLFAVGYSQMVMRFVGILTLVQTSLVLHPVHELVVVERLSTLGLHA